MRKVKEWRWRMERKQRDLLEREPSKIFLHNWRLSLDRALDEI